MANLSLKHKFLAGLASTIVVVVLGLIVTGSAMRGVASDFDEISERTTPTLITAAEVLTLALQVNRAVAQYATRPDPEKMAALRQQATESIASAIEKQELLERPAAAQTGAHAARRCAPMVSMVLTNSLDTLYTKSAPNMRWKSASQSASFKPGCWSFTPSSQSPKRWR